MPPTNPSSPAAHLTCLVKCVIIAIGAKLYSRAVHTPPGTEPTAATKAAGLAQAYLQNLARRFAALEARFLAGTLFYRPCASRAGQARPTRKPSRFASIPRRWGWLVHEIPECAWNGAGPLCALLQRPETIAMMQAAPIQTGRILRPICRLLLGKDNLPEILRPPPRPRPRRARKPDPVAAQRAASAHPDHLRAPRHRLGATWKGPGKIFTPPRKPTPKIET